MAKGYIMMRRRKTRKQSTQISHIVCRTVVAIIILEGIGGGPGGVLTMAKVEGAAGSTKQNQQSSYGRGRSNDDGGDYGSDSLINTFGSGPGGEATRRMRDRCGRYSLLRILQQWESLQRRCRLSMRNNGNHRDRERGRYEHIADFDDNDRHSFPPSLSDIDDISIGKRSRHPYYGAISRPNKNLNQHQNYYYEVNGDALESCCPVVFEVIAPIYGRNRSGHMVELYKDENVQQQFYEYRCHKDYLEQSCRYIDNQHRRISKCVQQYQDTYALVRSDTSMTGWSMEHIRVASGCACKVDPVKAAAHANRRRKKVASASASASSASHRNPNLFLSNGNKDKDKRKRESFQEFRSSSFTDY